MVNNSSLNMPTYGHGHVICTVASDATITVQVYINQR